MAEERKQFSFATSKTKKSISKEEKKLNYPKEKLISCKRTKNQLSLSQENCECINQKWYLENSGADVDHCKNKITLWENIFLKKKKPVERKLNSLLEKQLSRGKTKSLFFWKKTTLSRKKKKQFISQERKNSTQKNRTSAIRKKTQIFEQKDQHSQTQNSTLSSKSETLSKKKTQQKRKIQKGSNDVDIKKIT